MMATSTLCGEVSCPVAQLLESGAGGVPSSSQAARHPESCLPLAIKGQETGWVYLEAMLAPRRRPRGTLKENQRKTGAQRCKTEGKVAKSKGHAAKTAHFP